MTSDSDPDPRKRPRRISCGVVWGGIQPAVLDTSTQGINASLYSSASGGARGGDIYYMSLCPNDLRTRLLVADVQGHGEAVSEISSWIYRHLQEEMDSIDCAGVLSDLNKLVHGRGTAAITTAAVLSHDITEGAIYYSYAGHPPMLARGSGRQWSPLTVETRSGQANLPLGVFPSVRYDQGVARVRAGERILLYTDGLSEAMRPDSEEEFGEQELLGLLESRGGGDLSAVRDVLVDGATSFSGGPPLKDDCTLMVIEVR